MQNGISFSKIYLDWLNDNIEEIKLHSGIMRISTPFLDQHNDHTEFYIEQTGNNDFILSDDGVTLDNLESGGMDFSSSKKREHLLERILLSYGVAKGAHNDLTIESSMNTLAQSQHSLIQCMLKVNDLFFLSSPNVKNIFDEDVKNYFDEINVKYTSDVSLLGKSKLYTNYEFVIPHSKNSSDKFIKLANNIDTNITKSIIFSWEDTQARRKDPSSLITIINDSGKKISSEHTSALKEYNINPILWSKRDQFQSTFLN